MVPKMTTVETATAVLWLAHLTTDSAPNTAAAPQIALPVEVMRAVSWSIFKMRPKKMPKHKVPQTMMRSITIAGKPTA